MNVRYRVELSQAERDELSAMLSGGKHAVRKLKRAQILLAADAGSGDEEIARAVAVGSSTVYRTKRRFVEGNLERALSEEPRPGAERKLTTKEEALLVATACASPPDGRARWTLALLAGAMVKLTDHESLSSETVRRRLAENGLKPWRKDMWCIPQVDGEYVARMEDVNPVQFLKTVREYNAAVKRDAPFDPNVKDGRCTVGLEIEKSNWANALEKPPFVAYAVTCGITFTFGGLKIDGSARVIDTDGLAIPGLYAAGELVGGLFYFNYPGGTGLMAGSVFGRIAGTSAGQRARQQP